MQQLIENSRQNIQEIAKKVGFSRQKVWKIIKELEKDNTIWGYNAIIGEKTGERTTYFALIKLKPPIFDHIDTIIKRVKEKQISKLDIRIKGTYYLNGVYDGINIFTAKNIIEAKIFSSYLQKHYGDYIERIDILETIFPLIKCGKINPKLDQLKKFVIE